MSTAREVIFNLTDPHGLLWYSPQGATVPELESQVGIFIRLEGDWMRRRRGARRELVWAWRRWLALASVDETRVH